MEKLFIDSIEVEKFEKGVLELSSRPQVKSIMVLACDQNNWQPTKIDPILKKSKKKIFGGIFPQIINSGKNYEKGTILIGFPVEPSLHIVPNISHSKKDFMVELDQLAENWVEDTEENSIMVFIDGLSRRIESFVKSLFYSFGLDQNFIGGGAGSLSFEQKPCVLTNDGLIEDAAVLIKFPVSSGVGVTHGWEKISKSIKVTEAEQNKIISLNWRPAFDVYSELIKEHSDLAISKNNFFDISKSYPFGINKLGAEVVVRDPIQVKDDKSIICVGEIPKGSFLHLLHGNPENLILAAGEARKIAHKYLPKKSKSSTFSFFIDCISRVLFLGEDFNRELEIVMENKEISGILTLGEIANRGNDFLEFYNKTSVVGLFNIPE